ncbi:nucleotidyltransferase domain-containing protein [Cellulomonas endometrii]|uniref:nucleotidyltransferase domain-containing protein n=1 Tax=Cellulomonas endometrii TaxID=3036301 RepID=UPI0024AD148D|nr:nucleotidyltransferase domain-containing protein [Cellulomonas endometrii]
MLVQHPLEVVTPTVDGDVLAALARADAGFTSGELARLIPQHSVEGIRKVLNRLAAQGIVDGEQVGRAVQYRLNRDHLAAEAILALARQRATLLERLRGVLAAWSPRPVYAALFGSAARGDMRVDSDIDLFVVRPDGDVDDARWEEQTGSLAAVVTRWTGNDARVLEMTEAEVRAGAAAGDPVLRSLLDEEIPVAGPTTWLRRTVREATGARR